LAIQSLAVSTREGYARSWRSFEQFCETHDLTSVPAEIDTVRLYLASEVERGIRAGTVSSRLCAIDHYHAEAGFPPPGIHPRIAKLMMGIRRSLGTETLHQKQPLRVEELRSVCQAMDRLSPNRRRDCVLVSLAAKGMNASALSALEWPDVELSVSSLTLQVASRGARMQTLMLAAEPASAACPVRAVREWRAEIGARVNGPVLDRLRADGTLSGEAMAKQTVTTAMRRWARAAGLTVEGARAPAWEPTTAARALTGIRSPTLLDVRDRAMLLIGFALASRRANLIELTFGDVAEVPQGLRVHLARMKRDQEGRGTFLPVPRTTNALTCPTAAFLAWRTRVASELGGEPPPEYPLFGRVVADRLTGQALAGHAVAEVVKRRVAAAGLDPAAFAAHSLRSGFCTTASERGVELDKIRDQSRHQSIGILLGYIRSATLFHPDSAVMRIGL